MIRMGTIWDRSVEVMRGRSAILIQIVAVTVLVPTIIRAATASYGAGSTTMIVVGGLLSLVFAILALFGALALIAVASDPAVGTSTAYERARSRLPTAIGLTLLVIVALFILVIPVIGLVAASGVDFVAAARGVATVPTHPAMIGVAALYGLVLFVVVIWISARIALLNAVIVNERAGLGSFVRSWRLTRGLTWKIIGVLLLFGIVVVVCVIAAQVVTGLVFRLILGADAAATVRFLAAAAAAVVTAGWTVVQSAFLAQLYNAVTGREAATTFE